MLFRRPNKALKYILVIEDEPLIAFDNELRIEDAGYQVVATLDREDAAIIRIEQGGIDLVVADVNLAGGSSGVNVARSAYDHDIKVLFASGTCPADARKYALGCLNKPYSARELVKSIQAIDLIIQGKSPRNLPAPLSLYP